MGRAGRIDAIVGHLSLRALDRLATDGTVIGHLPRFCTRWAELQHRAQHLWDHLASALYDDHVPFADISFSNIVGIVQSSVADGHAADAHGLQIGSRGQITGPADVHDDVLQASHSLWRRVLVGSGPARCVTHRPQPILGGKIIDLDDQAVSFKVQRFPDLLPGDSIVDQFVKVGESLVLSADGETELAQIVQCFPLTGQCRPAIHEDDLVAEEAQRPGGGDG